MNAPVVPRPPRFVDMLAVGLGFTGNLLVTLLRNVLVEFRYIPRGCVDANTDIFACRTSVALAMNIYWDSGEHQRPI